MKEFLKKIGKEHITVYLINIALILFQFIYITLRYKYLNPQIPIWFTMPWGEKQLGQPGNIYIIPMLSLIIFITLFAYSVNAKAKYLRYGNTSLLTISTIANLLLTFSTLRIISVSTKYFNPIIPENFFQIILPACVSFLLVYLLTPGFIKYFKNIGIVTDPKIHIHPAMLLEFPSARGGGIIFTIGAIITALIFIYPSKTMLGIILAMIIAAIVGYIDDVQNTKPNKKFKWTENPVNRIALQVLVTLPLIFTDTIVKSINNPFTNTNFYLDTWRLSMFGFELAPIAIIFTVIWVIWIMNLLSWSNGVDGQYSGVIGITGIIIAFITLRLLHFDPSQKDMLELAAIIAGASFGILPYSWYPSKIMWGFGAISAGIAIASISVISQAKIATSIIVLTVPFLDGIITVVRRVINKKSPFFGDKGHLHHILLSRGWGKRRVAVFYWLSTLLFGLIGIYASDKDPILTTLTGCGVVAFGIILLNLKSRKR